MILILVFDFFIGLLSHKLRPFTFRFAPRIDDLMRYAIGLLFYIPLATLGITCDFRRHILNGKRADDKGFTERIFIDLLVTAVAYGGGVAVGFILDGGDDD